MAGARDQMTSPDRPSEALIAPVLFDALCALGEGVIILEQERIVFADPGSQRISGYSLDELLALTSVFQIVEPSERPAVAQRLQKRLRGEPQESHYESMVLHRDGHGVPVEIAAYLQDAAAKRLFVFVRDISARVALERERDRLHARTVATYEDLFERAPVGYHEVDLDGRIVRINDTELRLFGYARHEMLGRHSWEFSCEPRVVEAAVRALLAGEDAQRKERAFVRRNGETFWAWVQPQEIRDPSGYITGARAAILETTQLRRAQDALRTSEERHRRLFEQIPIGIYETTAEGRFVSVNPSLVRLLGYQSEQDLLAMPDVGALYARPDLRDQFKAALDSTESIVDFETIARTRDGRELVVLETAYAVRDDTGAIRSYQGTVTDLTDRRRLEEQLLQAQKMEAIGRFAGGVAHDFNNLLTVITGYAEMIANDMPSGSRPGADMQEILTATARAATMTKQLLAFSRKQVLQLRVADLGGIIRAVSPMLQRLIGEDVQLRLRLTADPLPIEADETQLQQVMLNLATNARDAMPSGGSLTLETAATAFVPGGAAGARVPEGGGWARLSVTDTGSGMDDRTRALIFEPFFTTKPADQGTGLGLATSYGIVKQMQGSILVESELGRGTTFSLYFPLKRAVGSHAVTGARPRDQEARGSAHIMVVEDESAVRELVTAVLRRAGYRVTAEPGPAEAMQISDETLASVDLLLSDVVMPGMRGPELVRALRERRRDLRAVFMTGYVDPSVESSTSVGRFLLKPFQPAHLLERIAEELRR